MSKKTILTTGELIALLAAVECRVPRQTILVWSPARRAAAAEWAETIAFGDPADVPPRPEWLARYDVRRCRRCGCTDARACAAGCTWAAADLCSACAGEEGPG